MSALSAIETPVSSEPGESDAVPRSSARSERPLALVSPASGPPRAGDATEPADSRHPRACSIPAGSGSEADRRRRAGLRSGLPKLTDAREGQRIVLQGRLIQAGVGRHDGSWTEPLPAGGSAAVSEAPARPERSRTRSVPGAAVQGARRTPTAPTASSHGDLARTPVRLTRRGRVVVGVLAVLALTAAVLVITLAASAGAQATNHGQARGGYTGMREIVVQPGQTLWSIAAAAEPSVDPRIVVQEIMSANAMTSATISVGQLLWVPR
jgi:LysM domain